MTRAPKIPIRRLKKEKVRHPPITLTSEAVVASAALVVSLLSLSTSAWFAVRGSVVTAVPPDSVFFYRDAGKGAVLTAGVDTALVNSASANHGDVVTRITMEIDTPAEVDPMFDYEVLVTPVFSETAERQAGDCPVTARCVRNGRFLAIEEPRRTLDVPGGASRSEYIGFVLEKGNCSISGACNAFVDLASASQALDRVQTLTIRFHYQLHADGEKTATCVLNLRSPGPGPHRPWLAQRLQDQGYAFLRCERRPEKQWLTAGGPGVTLFGNRGLEDITMTAPDQWFRRLRLARLFGVILCSAPMAACHLLAPSQPVPPPPPPPPPPTVSPPTGSELPTCPGDPRCDRA